MAKPLQTRFHPADPLANSRVQWVRKGFRTTQAPDPSLPEAFGYACAIGAIGGQDAGRVGRLGLNVWGFARLSGDAIVLCRSIAEL